MNSLLSEEQYRDFSRRVFEKTSRDHLPLKVQFEITYRCNIHCVHCYTDPFNNPIHLRKELTLDEMLKIFDELAKAGVLWMLLTGGEAFVHPQFKRIYREAKARGFIVSLFSNATTVTDDLLDFLAEDPPFNLEVSCHGATQEIFDKITQVPGSFNRFKEGVRKIISRGLPLKVKTKAMSVNRNELSQIKSFIEDLGLKFNLYNRIYPRLNGDLSSTLYRLSGKEIAELEYEGTLAGSGKAVETTSEDNICAVEDVSSRFTPPADDRLFRCGCGGNSITINPYGILRPCTFTVWPTYDLKVIPFREAFDQLVQTIRNARYTGDSACKICSAYMLCDKNPAIAVYETGSMEAPVPYFCETAFSKQARLEPSRPSK